MYTTVIRDVQIVLLYDDFEAAIPVDLATHSCKEIFGAEAATVLLKINHDWKRSAYVKMLTMI